MLKQKADTYAAVYIWSPQLTPADVRVFHRSIYSPAMLISLLAVATDEEEFDKIQAKVIPVMTQRLGFLSKLPTALRYGPVSMGGLNLLDLRTECGIAMIKYFRHEVYDNTKQVGQLLLLQPLAFQLESGLSKSLLEEPQNNKHSVVSYPDMGIVDATFKSNHNISILTLTDNFQFIMDLERLKGYTPSQQRDMNLVRIHLQVLTIADLVDSRESTRIATWAWEGHRPPNFCDNKSWPRQLHLSIAQRRLWKHFILSHYLRYDRYWRNPPRPSLSELKATMTTAKTPPVVKEIGDSSGN